MTPDAYQDLRRQLLDQRKQLSRAQIAKDSERLCQHFLDWFTTSDYADRTCQISAFWPIREEPDLRPLLKHLSKLGHTISLPVIEANHEPLAFFEWQADEPLQEAPFGTREPARHRPAAKPDIMLTPMLAYGQNGERMGYGGGFYDRTLEQLRQQPPAPLVLGVTWQCLQLPQDYLPQRHDQAINGILTENGLRFF
ncbi:5-formyltetrahydrofolate cyclo-ligase [Brackiella oedipodis]|uniref:5-formyltetrahydrofolate cyclo-ligase n=1 Tax=Brackiella oedipodis TaxID=124225 RepID=UPI000685F723|nr:5-formyltetrahydrofolate cyclo-ligase [Brackiella oedipodis]